MGKIIGITGLARAGKDTLATILSESGFERDAFANPIKVAMAAVAGESVEAFNNPVTKEQVSPVLGVTRRKAMQDFGMWARDTFGPDVWVQRLLNSWEVNDCPDLVISDVRFDNEAKALIDEGGIIVRVVREGAGLQGDTAKHVSESGVSDDLVSITVDNSGTIYELYQEAKSILAYVGHC